MATSLKTPQKLFQNDIEKALCSMQQFLMLPKLRKFRKIMMLKNVENAVQTLKILHRDVGEASLQYCEQGASVIDLLLLLLRDEAAKRRVQYGRQQDNAFL
ncbi:hypothetical protein TNCV_3095621 [Trichonephila clavipes]|nr:hypothetical protein TNCV_3095621 [Trichonephila clavipes]